MNWSTPKIQRRLRSAITPMAAACALSLSLAAAPVAGQAGQAQREGRALRIGIIGSGAMGAPLGLLWAEAGHQVSLSQTVLQALRNGNQKFIARTVSVGVIDFFKFVQVQK